MINRFLVYKLFLFLLFGFVFQSCFQLLEEGKNSVFKEQLNPGKSKKAILFLKDGNATMDNSLQVTIGPDEYELGNTEVGNVFTVDSDHNNSVQDSNSIRFTWLTNDTLVIDYDKNLRTFIKNNRVADVEIIYKPR
jgi:hypothetical protein